MVFVGTVIDYFKNLNPGSPVVVVDINGRHWRAGYFIVEDINEEIMIYAAQEDEKTILKKDLLETLENLPKHARVIVGDDWGEIWKAKEITEDGYIVADKDGYIALY